MPSIEPRTAKSYFSVSGMFSHSESHMVYSTHMCVGGQCISHEIIGVVQCKLKEYESLCE